MIVLIDTLRADRMSLYGSGRETSPRIDRVAQDSVVFDDAQTAAPLTVASLLSLMTSLYPEVHGVQGTFNPGRMSDNVTTLAEVLSDHGYTTAAFTEGGYARPDFGLGQGFQTFPRQPGDDDPNVTELLTDSRLGPNLDRTIAWLKEPRKKPFLLFFHTYEVHSPYWTLEKNVRRFRPGFDEAADHARVAQIITRFNAEQALSRADCLAMLEHLYQCPLKGLPHLDDPDAFERVAHGYGMAPTDAVHVEPLIELVRDLYDAGIRTTDDALDRLWSTLTELGLDDDTIVVITGDHGEGLGDHGEMEHSNVLHEEALRVPLIVHVPKGAFTPRRVTALVRSVDVMPTLLDLVGIDAGGLPLQGRSLIPLMRGQDDPARLGFSHARRVVAGQPPQYSVRDEHWRFVDEPATNRHWLYDRDADPGELADVSAAHPDVVARLGRVLEQQRAQDAWLAQRLDATPQPLRLDERSIRELHSFGYSGDAAPPPVHSPDTPK